MSPLPRSPAPMAKRFDQLIPDMRNQVERDMEQIVRVCAGCIDIEWWKDIRSRSVVFLFKDATGDAKVERTLSYEEIEDYYTDPRKWIGDWVFDQLEGFPWELEAQKNAAWIERLSNRERGRRDIIDRRIPAVDPASFDGDQTGVVMMSRNGFEFEVRGAELIPGIEAELRKRMTKKSPKDLRRERLQGTVTGRLTSPEPNMRPSVSGRVETFLNPRAGDPTPKSSPTLRATEDRSHAAKRFSQIDLPEETK